MWVTIPLGSVLGAAGGGALAGGAPRQALLGSAAGFLLALAAGPVSGGDHTVATLVFHATHGLVTAAFSARR